MVTTTIGVKITEELRARLKSAAEAQGRTPHWLVKQAIIAAIDGIERGGAFPGEAAEAAIAILEQEVAPGPVQPFLEFAQGVQPQTVLRARITEAYRRPEEECLPLLLAHAALPATAAEQVRATARTLVEALRARQRHGGVEGLLQEFSLSSHEGVALMCLAEALLRIPDRATRDALIRDKISGGDWSSHLGHSPSLFVNAATWGLVVTGRLTATTSEAGLSGALTRLIGRGGEPVIRKGVDLAIR